MKKWQKWALAHLAVAAAVAITVVQFVGTVADQSPAFRHVLNKAGERIYQQLEDAKVEQGQRAPGEALPAGEVAKLTKLNDTVAATELDHPRPLATPEPKTLKRYVRNQSSRVGARPLLWVVHDAEMPNAPGVQDLFAIDAWFDNPLSQASSNYATDADGNTIEMVPVEAKAWTQSFFNPWAISDELIGYASQRTWPEAQLRAAAQLAAHDTARYGIPVQHGKVRGCTIVTPGILQHSDLGACGGGHHDAGPNFPIHRFIALVNQYRHGGVKPKVPLRRCTTKELQRALNAHGARPRLAVDGIRGPRTNAALRRIRFSKLGLHCHR